MAAHPDDSSSALTATAPSLAPETERCRGGGGGGKCVLSLLGGLCAAACRRDCKFQVESCSTATITSDANCAAVKWMEQRWVRERGGAGQEVVEVDFDPEVAALLQPGMLVTAHFARRDDGSW